MIYSICVRALIRFSLSSFILSPSQSHRSEYIDAVSTQKRVLVNERVCEFDAPLFYVYFFFFRFRHGGWRLNRWLTISIGRYLFDSSLRLQLTIKQKKQIDVGGFGKGPTYRGISDLVGCLFLIWVRCHIDRGRKCYEHYHINE